LLIIHSYNWHLVGVGVGRLALPLLLLCLFRSLLFLLLALALGLVLGRFVVLIAALALLAALVLDFRFGLGFLCSRDSDWWNGRGGENFRCGRCLGQRL
jgi:hypothetical protein